VSSITRVNLIKRDFFNHQSYICMERGRNLVLRHKQIQIFFSQNCNCNPNQFYRFQTSIATLLLGDTSVFYVWCVLNSVLCNWGNNRKVTNNMHFIISFIVFDLTCSGLFNLFFGRDSPQWARALLIHKISGSHTQRHTTLVGLLWTSERRSDNRTHTTDRQTFPRWDSNSQSQ
jgi:hypothetical protein